jgi:spore coat protein U-like protein
MFRNKLILSIASASALMLGSSAFAANESTTLAASVTVPEKCVAVTAEPVAFGEYDGTAAATASASISVTCTLGTVATISLDEGANGDSTNARKLANGGEELNYQLYSDANRNNVWDNAAGTEEVTGVGLSSAVTVTVFGEIPTGQDVTPGVYGDVVNVTVSY